LREKIRELEEKISEENKFRYETESNIFMPHKITILDGQKNKISESINYYDDYSSNKIKKGRLTKSSK
jgi:hypothetical protein